MNGPQIWNPLFKAARTAYGSALIAGGSPRDWVVHKSLNARDFDVFVPAADENDLEDGIPDLQASGLAEIRLIEPDVAGYTADELNSSNVTGVLEARLYVGNKDLVVNVIGKTADKIADPFKLMLDFDHSLCHFVVTPDGEMLSTEAAQKTLDTGVVTLYNAGIETDVLSLRTAKRLARMKARGKSYDRFTWATDKAEQPKAKQGVWGSLTSKPFTVNVGDLLRWEDIAVRPVGDPIRHFR